MEGRENPEEAPTIVQGPSRPDSDHIAVAVVLDKVEDALSNLQSLVRDQLARGDDRAADSASLLSSAELYLSQALRELGKWTATA